MSATKQEQYKTAMGKYDYLAPNEITVCIPKAEYEELITFKTKVETAENYKALICDMDNQIEALKAEVSELRKAVPEIELPELEVENV